MKNQMHGEGYFEWENGKLYKGSYKDDKKHGYGILIQPNGKSYKGNWANGFPHGKGYIKNNSNSVERCGEWKNGKRMKWLEENENP